MKRRYHRWYSKTYNINDKLTKALTTQGQAVFLIVFALFLFGLNTRASLLYHVFSIALTLLIIDAISLVFKIPPVKVTRYIPGNVVAGKTAKYNVSIKTKRYYLKRNTLYYREVPADPRPSYETFISTPEPGENKRNWFDKRMAYYRWKWIVERNLGAKYSEFQITGKTVGDEVIFSAEITPVRRGKIKFACSFVYVKGVFGLFKRGRCVENPQEVIVLPEIFPIEKIDFMEGASDEASENTRETEETGAGYELKSLREYVPGDSPRFIHWKSSAKTGTLKIREHHKEIDAGTVIFLDTFIKESYKKELEGAVSLTASLLDYFSAVNMMPSMLIAGNRIYEIDSNTKEIFQELLVVLALVETLRENEVAEMFPQVSLAGSNSGSVLFVTPDYDDKKHQFALKLQQLNIKVFPICFGERKTTLPPMEKEIYLESENLHEEFRKL